jgi:hypothetical protein
MPASALRSVNSLLWNTQQAIGSWRSTIVNYQAWSRNKGGSLITALHERLNAISLDA